MAFNNFVSNCVDNNDCNDLEKSIDRLMEINLFENISFDKKLNEWVRKKNLQNKVYLNSWSYYANDIYKFDNKHKRMIYKNK